MIINGATLEGSGVWCAFPRVSIALLPSITVTPELLLLLLLLLFFIKINFQ